MRYRSLLLHGFFLLLLALSHTNAAFADTSPVLRPLADGGDDSALWADTLGTACSGTNCAAEVDESSGASCTTSDGDISFIQSSTLGANQTFSIDVSGVPDGSTITAISITACYLWNNQSSSNTFQTRQCVNGSCTNSGVDIPPVAVYTEATQSHAGLGISKTGATDLEVGVSYTGTKGRLLSVSQVFATLTYTPPTSVATGGGGGVAPTAVVFAGQAYPSSTVEVVKRSSINGAFRHTPDEVSSMDPDGKFLKSYTGLIGAQYLFTLYARDADGRASGPSSFNVDLLSENSLQVLDILFPPTLGFEPETVLRGKDVHIVGYAAKNFTVELEVGNTIMQKTTSDERGRYEFSLNTGSMESGKHAVRVRETDPASDPKDVRRSGFSPARIFTVTNLTHTKSDFNNDNRVDIADWSIFLFRWSSTDQPLRSSLDINADGRIDVTDFSIFLQSISAKA